MVRPYFIGSRNTPILSSFCPAIQDGQHKRLTAPRFICHYFPPAMTTVAAMMTTMTAGTVVAATATATRFTRTMMAINVTTMFAVRFGNTA